MFLPGNRTERNGHDHPDDAGTSRARGQPQQDLRRRAHRGHQRRVDKDVRDPNGSRPRVNDLPAAEGLIKKSFSGIKVLESVPTAEEYGIVVSKDNPGLTAALNKAIQTLIDNGTMEKITATWIN